MQFRLGLSNSICYSEVYVIAGVVIARSDLYVCTVKSCIKAALEYKPVLNESHFFGWLSCTQAALECKPQLYMLHRKCVGCMGRCVQICVQYVIL